MVKHLQLEMSLLELFISLLLTGISPSFLISVEKESEYPVYYIAPRYQMEVSYP